MLKTKNRLKKRKEFNFLYKKGKKLRSLNFGLVFIKSKYKTCRIGISVNNKVGNAVARNKIKRQIRAILSQYVTQIYYKNFIIVAYPTAIDLDFRAKQNELTKLLIKGNLVNE